VIVLEFWKGVPGWLAPARHVVVRVLHWVKEHWLNAAAIAAIGGVAAAIVPFVIRSLDRRGNTLTDERLARERVVMLHRVRYKWITSVLDRSLGDAAELALVMQTRPDVLEVSDGVIRRAVRPTESPLSGGATITQIFDDVAGGLLIMGAPGAGKTTLLLKLTGGLLDQAERDPARPIPVVMNLASWAARRLPLEEWLTEELVVSYNVPRSTASMWVAQDALALLLDGLDEVADHQQVACAEAINDYRHNHGLVQMAVCSRTQKLEDLAVKLSVDEAIELLPLTDAQINEYLGHLPAAGTAVADMRAILTASRDLQDFRRTPLMLHVIALAYHGRPALALSQPGSWDIWQERLWNAYVSRMFEQRPLPPGCRYTREQAVAWLAWLARALREHNQVEFHLDRLTLDWLPLAVRPQLTPLWRLLRLVAANYLNPVEDLHWSGRKIEFNVPKSIGLVASVLLGLLVILAATPVDFAQNLTVRVWGIGLIFGFGLAIFATLSLGLSAELRDERTMPNEGVRRSARYGAFIGLAAGVIFGLIYGLLDGLVFHVGDPWLFGLGAGLITGVIVATITGWGACLVHYAVVARLVKAGQAPRHYQAFLDSMSERLLLIHSGSGYMFFHRLLHDYFAESAAEAVYGADGPKVR